MANRLALPLVAICLVVSWGAFTPSTGALDAAEALTCVDKGSVDASEIERAAEARMPILLSGCLVKGDLNLSRLKTIEVPVVISGSQVEGSLDASFLIFQGIVDFTETKFLKSPTFYGSIFQEDATFAKADFGKDGSTSMKRVIFKKTADFRSAFFHGPAEFQNTSMEGRALFQRTIFEQKAEFEGVLLKEVASFVQTWFGSNANFRDVASTGDLDLSDSDFDGDADFTSGRINGTLSLNYAEFSTVLLLDDVSAETLDLREARFLAPGSEISMDNLSAKALLMDLEAVDRVKTVKKQTKQQIEALRLIEHTFRERGSLDVANDASFRRQELEDRDAGQPRKALRVFFSRWIGGYGVRPLHPLGSMAVVIMIGWLGRLSLDPKYHLRFVLGSGWRKIRAAAGWLMRALPSFKMKLSRNGPLSSEAAVGEPKPDEPEWPWLARTADAFVRTVGVVISAKPGQLIKEEDRGKPLAYGVAALLLAEYLVQKALIFALALTIANAIPGAKDFIDAVKPS